MASRLSYVLWDSMPDDELFAAASQGELSSREEVMDQARRMLEDDRAREAVTHFHRQWLGMQDIHTISPARSAYGPRYGLSADTALDTTDDYDWPYVLIHVRSWPWRPIFIGAHLDSSGRFETLMTDHGYVLCHVRSTEAKWRKQDRVTWYEATTTTSTVRISTSSLPSALLGR